MPLNFGNFSITSGAGQEREVPATSSAETLSEDIAAKRNLDRFRRNTRNAPVVVTPFGVSFDDIGRSTSIGILTQSFATVARPRVRPQNPLQPNDTTSGRVDTLQLSNNTINAIGFSTSSLNGFSSQRPEILALIDYETMFENQSELRFNDTGYFIDYKYQSTQLRKDTVLSLYVSLSRNQTTEASINQFNNKFTSFIAAEDSKLRLFQSVINIFDLFDKAFQIREINDDYFSINRLLNIKQFFTRKMGYSETSYNTFSDTKILYQLLFDLRSASEDYSFNLLNISDPNRTNDLNSVNIDTTYSKTNGFSFSLPSIKTPLNSTTPKSATAITYFGSFMRSLPQVPTDRIKLLMQVLNRILRVSRGLSKATVRNEISTNFSVSEDDDPFDNILGAPPRDIFTKPLGTNTIGGSLYLTATANPGLIILPFENTIVDDGETTYLPGNLFFKNITAQNGSIDNLMRYSEDTSRRISNTVSVYNQIFDFNDQNNKLLPTNFSLKFLNAVKNSLNYINTSQTNGNPTRQSLLIPALINYAQNDAILKYQLFQFLLLLGISSITNVTERSIFRNLKRELKNTKAFPDLSFEEITLDPDINQSNILRAAALSMARRIARYVYTSLVSSDDALIGNTGREGGSETALASGFQRFFIQNEDQIANTLMETVSATYSNQPNLFKDFIDIAITLDQDALISGNSDTYLNANLFTTKYGNISISYILLILFEIICSFTKRFFDINFDTERTRQLNIIFSKENCLLTATGLERTIANTPSVLNTTIEEISLGSVNTGNTEAVLQVLENVLLFNPQQIEKINLAYDATKRIVEALVSEENFIKNILGIFTIISTNLNNAKRIGIDVFNRLTEQEKNILKNNSNILKKPQYRIASELFNQLGATISTEGSLINPYAFSITEDEYNHLLCLNNSLKTLSNERTKILTVGLPNGFIDSLSGKSSKTAAISGAEQIVDLKVEKGLIYLAVYRKSLLFEDLKFKPKRFIFDLALFANQYPDSLTIDPFGIFSAQNGLITLKDKTNINTDINLTLSNIDTYSRYITYLSNAEKREMFVNHIKDYLFQKYINLLTGFKLTEEVFPINPYYNFISDNDQVNQLLRLYLTTLGISDTRTIREILLDETISISIRDSLSLMQNCVVAFKTELIDEIIFSGKLFDRIFNIQINIDTDFEVDTKSTPSNVLNNETIASRLFKIGGKTFIRDLDSAIMDEFYVSVEGIG
jgi:hypothetical protein